MQAFEFEAEIHDGVIDIPKRYLGQLPTKGTVIVLTKDHFGLNQDAESKAKNKSSFLENIHELEYSLPNNYAFNRDEIYDR